ncbi:MAG: MBOAT family O-acyltransferase, partial [Clostridiales bacterium]
LGFFKYADFVVGMINGLIGMDMPLPGISLPIGISFFTFQTMSYTIDVYRGEVKAQQNLATFTTFVCLFPQLIAGPIVRYADIGAELMERHSEIERIGEGLRRFVLGLAKKVLIANALGELTAVFIASPDKSVLFFWLYAVAFTLQIYFDFSGYSDMAIGLGRVFGFSFPENFNYPYLACSITEFWRRWHMTLGSWFRDYVYIPLGGNRQGTGKWLRNIFIVWLLTG